MVSRDDGKYVLYPIYFDARQPRPPRRVRTDLAVNSPSADEVAKAAQRVGVKPVIERGKQHPSRWFRDEGRVLVDAIGSKEAILRQVAEEIAKARRVKAQAD